MGQVACPPLRRLPGAARLLALLAAAALTLLAGCGGDDDTATANGQGVDWTLVLDYEPNAVHSAILHAKAVGYFAEAGIDLDIVAPSSTSDSLTQVQRGRADLGLADLIDVAGRNADANTDPLRVVGAIVQRPLGGILVDASGPVRTPQQLAGRRIAVTGLPSDVAVVDAITGAGDRRSGGPAGIRPAPPELVTLGFNGIKALHAGRVDGATAYWPADAVTLRQLGTEPRIFTLDENGGPRYPGLVAFAGPEAASDREHLDAFTEILARSTREVVENPELGLGAINDAYPELDKRTTRLQLQNYLPLFGTDDEAGRIDRSGVQAFARFAAQSGLTDRELSVDQILGREQGTPTTP